MPLRERTLAERYIDGWLLGYSGSGLDRGRPATNALELIFSRLHDGGFQKAVRGHTDLIRQSPRDVRSSDSSEHRALVSEDFRETIWTPVP